MRRARIGFGIAIDFRSTRARAAAENCSMNFDRARGRTAAAATDPAGAGIPVYHGHGLHAPVDDRDFDDVVGSGLELARESQSRYTARSESSARAHAAMRCRTR
jgi:hypothetical protein